ncbi:MAG: DUF512 domain-containing protein [Clostridiales bacterium]
MKSICPRIENILPHSIGEKHSICRGELLKSINGHLLRDIIDYQFLTANEDLTLEIQNHAGVLRTEKIHKSFEDDLGIVFESAVFDGIRSCKNNCIFCFVSQMPKGYRPTLYVKDDDYRLSFLYGNYITLTNLTNEDYKRIVDERLSPLYISIHCADEKIRTTLLGIKNEKPIMPQLRKLAEAGIEIHGQIVLVPGYNDGEILENTIAELETLGDNLLSLALVPVGLTKCQKNNLRIFTKAEAKTIIKTVKKWQTKFQSEKYTNLIFAADEFYLLADEEIPNGDFYEDYPQIENGVGIIRQFYDEFDYEYEVFPHDLKISEQITLITGVDGAKSLQPKIAILKNQGINIETLAVPNNFFGETVTVTGLLTGGDIIDAIKIQPNVDENVHGTFLIPDILLKHHSNLLLDDITINEIEDRTNRVVKVIATDAATLLNTIKKIGKE